jgi:hypothetical protein
MKTNSFVELLRLANNYFLFVTGLKIKPLKKFFFWTLPFSVLFPVVAVSIATALKSDTLATWFVVIVAILNITPWLLLTYVAVVGYAPLIPLTLFSEFIPKFQEINAGPEKMKKIKVYLMDIIAWLLFAYIYIVVLQIWHVMAYFPLLILIILFFIISVNGGWVIPDPKFKQKLWRLVSFTFLIITVLIVVKPRLFYWTGIFPHELTYPYKNSAKQLENLDKTMREKKDAALAKQIKNLDDAVKKYEDGEEIPTNLNTKADTLEKKVKENLGKETALKKVWGWFSNHWPGRGKNQEEKTPPVDKRNFYAYHFDVGPGWTEISIIPQIGEKFEVEPFDGLKWQTGGGNILELNSYSGKIDVKENKFKEFAKIYSPEKIKVNVRRIY